MWLVIMLCALLLASLSLIYLSSRVCRFGFIKNTPLNKWRRGFRGLLIIALVFVIIAKWLNFVNAIVCAFYFAGIWLLCDLGMALLSRLFKRSFRCYYAGVAAIVLSLVALSWGWWLNHHIFQTTYNLQSTKITRPLKVAMFADSHLGTTFDAAGFAQHLKDIEQHSPDVLIVAGDFVDDDTSKDEMIAAAKSLGEFKAPLGIYFVFGNHDEGYYGRAYRGYTGDDLVAELEKNGIQVLADEAKLLNNEIYLLGRKDLSADREGRGGRYKMADLARPLDKRKYIIVADHQPADYAAQAQAKVDLVLSGHTHGGQLFPFNQIGKWIGALDRVYGYERREKTDFIVTSGISDWTIKFKTGTKSEFVIINVEPKK